jgi:transcriptional regulator with XRE-family HTH domain
MSAIVDALRAEFRDQEYSEGYAESFLNSYVATQIKVIREQRGMKQADLAREMGTTQTAISRIENVNYSSWNIKTLKRLARAFGVRLKVSFETYGTLPQEVEGFGRGALQRAAREEDPGLLERIGPQRESAEEAMAAAVGIGAGASNSWSNNLLRMPQPWNQAPEIPQSGGLNAT